jgi:CelD/BcsL family acetyltransferase involved in cellulose biosynthesis
VDLEVSREAPEGWNRLVEEDRAASFFHRTEWTSALLASDIDLEPLYIAGRSGTTVVAGLPAAYVKHGPLTTLESMPVGTYGALVLGADAPSNSAQRLVDTFARLASRPGVASAHLVDEAGRVERVPGHFVKKVYDKHTIRLDAGFDVVWSGFKPSARNKVRKARKAGVTVRRASSESDFLSYHEMLLECCGRWGEREIFGRTFFAHLSRLDTELVQMWLAEHEGNVIGGDLNFAAHGRIMNWGNVSRTSALRLAPNNLLHAAAMEDGADRGYVEYDLGASAGIAGVDSFKAAFGTTLVPLIHYNAGKMWFRALKRAREHGARQ